MKIKENWQRRKLDNLKDKIVYEMEFKAFSFYVEGILLVSEGHALNVWILRTRGKNTYLLPSTG